MSKRNISYVQQDEPSFLRQFKQRVGYKEGPNVDTKREDLPTFDEDCEDRPELDDDKPVVVVLKKGDLTQEEADELDKSQKDEEEAGERIIFKKPTKRSSEDTETASAKKPAMDDKDKQAKDKKSKKKKSRKAQNKSLLSFNEDEDEEGE